MSRPQWPDGAIEMDGVRDCSEGMEVLLVPQPEGRMAVLAYNQAGYDYTTVDLEDLITWLRANRPELLESKK